MRRLSLFACLALAGCPDPDDRPVDTDSALTETDPHTDPHTDPAAPTWQVVAEGLDAALLSVHGTAADDVWAVGADTGEGPLVLRYDGTGWTKLETGFSGDLWWVHAGGDGTVWMVGANANVLRYRDGVFTRLPVPGLAKHLLFGAWASADGALWVVGAAQGRQGFAWRYDGAAWTTLPLPDDVPLDAHLDPPSLFKVWGDDAGTVWVVGDRGTLLRSVDGGPFARVDSGVSERLLTIAGDGDDVVAVGGDGGGVLLERDGDGFAPVDGRFPVLQGVAVGPDGSAWATGLGGAFLRRDADGWIAVETGLFLTVQSLHAVWVDPDGGVWAAGGDVLSTLLDGALVHLGPPVAGYEPEVVVPPPPSCPAEGVDPQPDGSIARRWSEQLLNAIRRDVPRPGVHARNLFHTGVALWDAWAAYDDGSAVAVLFDEAHDGDAADVEVALSHAAYRVLHHRYAGQTGGDVTVACLDAFLAKLGLDPSDTRTVGDDPVAVGNRIGALVVDTFADDGANEAADYADTTGWTPTNPPLVVDLPGTRVDDVRVWQQLVLAEAETQNGLPAQAGVQGYIGAHWEGVRPFALVRPDPGAPYFEPDGLPEIDALITEAVDVVVKTSRLDPTLDATIDASPGAYGNNTLGHNDGAGHALNPVTGAPYAPQVVREGDFFRVLAEYWADGPQSETPPGHWLRIAHEVADHPDFERRLFGEGERLDPLAWDVHVALAMGGAVHDAAVAAWELKRVTLGPRPITLIRWAAQNGQRTDLDGPAYHPLGIDLVPGVIEVITAESSAPGERHAHLARHVGRIALLGWRGEPGDRASEVGGVGWMLGVDWIPYQRRTFVTPAFPGFVSGHSTFSRAAAEVLAAITGSPYYPGGFAEFVAPAGDYLVFEDGPSASTALQWATYFDAADQAGQSRLWGGIHVVADDMAGRRVGHEVGLAAVAEARRYFEGTAE